MDINKFVDGQMAAWARNDLIGMLADAGHALVQTGLKVNGVRYQDMLVGPLLIQAAAALEECWKREGLIQAAANRRAAWPGESSPARLPASRTSRYSTSEKPLLRIVVRAASRAVDVSVPPAIALAA